MIEIKSNSLLGFLLICSFPLLYIVTIVLLARKRIIENEQIRKELRKSTHNKLFDYIFNYKWMLIIGLVFGSLIFAFSSLAGFVLIAYKNSVPDQVPSWAYLSLMAITFFCGGVAGMLLLFFIYKRNSRKDKII